MSLQSIYDALNGALHGGTIDLTGATVPDLDLTLRALGLTGSDILRLTDATLVLNTDAVVLTGTAANYLAFGWTATLTGVPEATGNRFTLALAGIDGTTPWTFGTSFLRLPQSRHPVNTLLELEPSVLTLLRVDGPSFSATSEPGVTDTPPARFQGWLSIAGSALSKYAVFFGASRFHLDGTINFKDKLNPVISLWGAAPAKVSLAPIPIDEVGIKLLSHVRDTASLEADAVVSMAAVYAKLRIGKAHAITGEVTGPLIQSDWTWPLAVTFSPVVTLPGGLAAIMEFFGQTDAQLFSFPLADSVLDKFGLQGVELGIQPPLNGDPLALRHATLAFTSSESWQPTVAFVKVRQLGTSWTYRWYLDEYVTGNVWGKLVFFDSATVPGYVGDAVKVELTINADLPDFIVTGAAEVTARLQPGSVFQQYLGGSAGPLAAQDLTIARVQVQADPYRQTYQGWLAIDGGWGLTVNLVTFRLERILAHLNVSQAKVTGSLGGAVSIQIAGRSGPVTKSVFDVAADYRGDGRWKFSGGLSAGKLKLIDFAAGLLGFTPQGSYPEVNLLELRLAYETAPGAAENPYSAQGALELKWTPQALGMTLSVTARARIARRKQTSSSDRALAASRPDLADNGMILEGALSGTFQVDRLAVSVGLSFTGNETVYFFEVAFRQAKLRAATLWIDDRAPPASPRLRGEGGTTNGRHQILSITLSGFTLGDLVEYLVNLANPNQNYQLDAPWSFLNAIDLSRFEVQIDPDKRYQSVAVVYHVDLDVGFASLKTVGVRYDRASGTGRVNFILTGSFLGKEYGPGNELAWDAVNDPPPEVPGKGAQLFDLRYLGMGQHVTLTGLTRMDSVTGVLHALADQMRPVKDPSKNPLAGSRLRFDASSQWMFGIDCTVMDTVSLGIVLHDPDLYGLVVSLAGPQAGGLAGLQFELLYKKVTDDVGVFRVRLQVPDAFRQIDFGTVAITLGVITVDVFTNGNFLVDLGFPHERDFSASFGLQVGPFLGFGGIYFGVLDGATSRRVPAITNGTFDPVLELGVGLSVGVGRTFNKGPLKAGVYVQVVAILEGVLGWFHPSDMGAPVATYYWFRGSAGLVGKLYGSVDFKIIKVSVSVEAHAIVTVTFSAYRQTLLELDVGVEVSAEVTILFVTVSFSFGLQLSVSFTIGDDQVTPWILAADQEGRGDRAIASPRRRALHVRQLTRALHLLARHGAREQQRRLRTLAAGAQDTAYDLNWRTDIFVYPDGGAPHPMTVKMVPAYTVDRATVQWPGQNPPAPSTDWRLAFVLMIDGGTSPAARTIAESRRPTAAHSATARDATDTAVHTLIEGMLRWAVSALGIDPVHGSVMPGQLEELARQLDLPQAAADLDMARLGAFFIHNAMQFRVSGIPSGTPGAVGGVAFPIPPALGWDTTVPADPYRRRFDSFRMVDAAYEQALREYFSQLDPQPHGGAAAGGSLRADPAESMASFVFRDWFLMLAKTAVQSALTLCAAFPCTVRGLAPESLDTVSSLFPRITAPYVKHAGDTVSQVAQFFGYAAAELVALDAGLPARLLAAQAGTSLDVTLGVTPESIAAANPDWPLNPGVKAPLGELAHQVAAGETLKKIADDLHADVDAWLQQADLLRQRSLLAAGSAIALQGVSYENTGGLPLAQVAALFFVRLRGADHLGFVDAAGVPMIEWYVQAVGMLNTIVDGALPPQLRVPSAFDKLADPRTWRTLPGDSVWSVAAMFAILQNAGSDADFVAWRQAVANRNPGADPLPRILLPLLPESDTVVLAGETLAALAARLPVQLPDPDHAGAWLPDGESFRALVRRLPLLLPLAQLTVPDCQPSTQSGDTLAIFADRYALALDAAGGKLAPVPGLLAAWPGHDLVVPHPPLLPLGADGAAPADADLIPAVLAHQSSTIAAQLSRFFYSGMRLPVPGSTTGEVAGLFELVGQQIPGPARPAAQPQPPYAEAFHLTVQVFDPAATWVALYDSAALERDHDLAPLHALNPGLARRNDVTGLIALTAPVTSLVFSLTDHDLWTYYPDARLVPDFTAAPAARALYRDVPVDHGLQQRILWQADQAPPFPTPAAAPVAGALTLWPFPGNLVAAAARFPLEPFALYTIDAQLGPAAQPAAVGRYAWATLLDVRIKRVPGRPNTYELFGADTAGRQVLRGLWEYLAAPAQQDTATLGLLFQQSAGAGLPAGLSSFTTSDALTYLVKTNLSTETRSGNVSGTARDGDPPTSGAYYARLSDATRFLTLLWECSVVGGGGYWLEYTRGDGSALPETIFAADGTATLSLLALLASQATGSAPDRRLKAFNNAAVVGDAIDAASANVVARVANQSETHREATVEPGNIAFGATLRKVPKNTLPPDRQILARQLYGMLGYQLKPGGTAYAASDVSLPIGPRVPPAALRAVDAPADEDTWDMLQVIPVARFALRHPLPNVFPLPLPADDPYAGINDGPAGPPAQRPTVNVAVTFREIFGNTSALAGDAGSGGPDTLGIRVGYTDDVIGVGAWPATTASFDVAPAADPRTGAVLQASLRLQPTAHLPSPSQPANSAARTAREHGSRFARVYYQQMQPRVNVRLLTSLEVTAGQPQPLRTDGSVRGFVAGACAWLATAGALQDATPVLATEPTLSAVAGAHGVGYDALAAANAGVPLANLFVAPPQPPVTPSDFSVPTYGILRAGSTVAGICPPHTDPAQILGDAENIVLPLRVGTELTIPVAHFAVPGPPEPPRTLREIATALNCSAEGLASLNAGTPSLLAEDFTFTCDGVLVAVAPNHKEASLDAIAALFQAQGVQFDAVMVASANADVPGMFRAGAALAYDGYLARKGETLERNASGSPAGVLAPLNTTVPDLFDAGTPVYTGFVSGQAVFEDTVAGAAAVCGISPEQLLRHNAAVPLAAPASDVPRLVIPGEAVIPAAAAALRLPFALPAGAKLADVAALFINADPAAPDAATALAQANLALPGTLAGGQTISAGGQTVPTQDGDSFADVLARFHPAVSLAAVVQAIAGTAGFLQPGALLLVPPAELGASPAAWKPADVALRYGVGVADFALANVATAGLVAKDATLTMPRGKNLPDATITTGASDTFNSLVWRFAREGVQAAAADIVAANAAVAFVRANARLLLAPPPAELSARFGRTGWCFPQSVFAIHTWLEIARERDLVDPDFRGPEDAPWAAVRDRTAIPPLASTLRNGQADGVLKLAEFARNLRAAVPVVRAATGKVQSEAGADRPADVWAVSFGSGHIEKVAIAPGVTVRKDGVDQLIPRYFALRPLQNSLVSRTDVLMQPLQADGTLGTAAAANFQGVDLETWAARFLADVDLFLTAAYAAPAYRTKARQGLETILAGKKKLALAVAQGLDYTLDLGQPDPSRADPPPADWAAAVQALQQRLLASLSSGYAVDAIVQYDATIASGWAIDSARLSGTGVLPPALAVPGQGERRVQVSSAKTHLAATAPGLPSYVSFLVDVAEDGQQRSIALADLRYRINELEFHVTPVVDGYDASDWLSFILPFGDDLPPGVTIDMGQPDVPLPQRGYPPLPSLLGQQAPATHPDAADYTQATHWNYVFSCQHQSAAADHLGFEVELNRPPMLRARSDSSDDLFAKLAQYMGVAPALWDLLQQLTALDKVADPTVLENAIRTFAGLVDGVAGAWGPHWTGQAKERLPRKPAVRGPTALVRKFTMTLDVPDVPPDQRASYSFLHLTRDAQGGLDWPFVQIFTPGGPRHPLGQGEDWDGGRRYTFPPGIPAWQLLCYEFEFRHLHVATYQNGHSQVHVRRNTGLSQLAPTREAFVYETRPLAFPDLVTPLLTWTRPFPIGLWSDTPAANPLVPVFAALFDGDPDSRTISCAIRYGYELAVASPRLAIVPYLPVKFRPTFAYQADAATGTVRQIIDQVTKWRNDHDPASAGGEWSVVLTLYSSLAGQVDRPLVVLPVTARITAA
jgi:hypothetical protein